MTIDLNTMTPEMKSALMQSLIASTFSSKSIHAIGDNLAMGIIKLASATQTATNVAAKYSGTVEALAVPATMKALVTAKAVVTDLGERVVAGVSAGYKTATAPKSSSHSPSV